MSSAKSERPDWRFSLRLALGVGGLFVVAVIAIYLGAGQLLERALGREEASLVLDRVEDLRIAWQDSGGEGLGKFLKELETTTGEQLAVRVENAAGQAVFEGATAAAPELHWADLAGAPKTVQDRVGFSGGWSAVDVALPGGETLRAARFSPTLADVRQTYRGLFATMVVPSLLVGVLGGMLLVMGSLRPLRRTVAVMRHIVRTGDWTTRVEPPRAAGEMRDLAESFNSVLERQQRLVESLRQTLDSVAHDLRTPLTRLQITVETGLTEGGAENPPAAVLADCLEEVQKVQATLSTLLDVAEAEAGAMKLNRATITAAGLLAEVAELYEFAAEEKGARIDLATPEAIEFMGDGVRLRRALANLVDNALKYLGDGKRITLSAEKRGTEVVLNVRDDGLGISAEDLPRIWDRLFRADRSRSAPGMGLGLSLVKAITEAHDGHVDVESAPGRGSTFSLILPLKPAWKPK
jgi:signal transduction histidine kinase